MTGDLELDAADLQELVAAFKTVVLEETGQPFPQDPREQLTQAINAVFSSWNSERAVLYRRQERIPNGLGTAVNIVAMVFGNTGPDSGTGVCFTRDPATGAQGIYGDYLPNAQGEDVVAGIRNTVPLAELETIDKASYDQLLEIMPARAAYRDLGNRVHHRSRPRWRLQTSWAAPRRRCLTVAPAGDEGRRAESHARVSGARLVQRMLPSSKAAAEKTRSWRGRPLPGARSHGVSDS